MPHIHGERIVLREYRMSDFQSMREWVNDPEITQYLSDIFLYPHSEENTEQFLRQMIKGGNESLGLVIADKNTLDYIGQIDLHRIDWKNRCSVLGIVIGKKENLGQGYGREAIMLLQDYVFNNLNLRRLELEVLEFNERAYRCYLKCGFQEEGRLRKKQFRNGRYWDVICMGILKEDYEKRVATRA